jgi:hypothetical protein
MNPTELATTTPAGDMPGIPLPPRGAGFFFEMDSPKVHMLRYAQSSKIMDVPDS